MLLEAFSKCCKLSPLVRDTHRFDQAHPQLPQGHTGHFVHHDVIWCFRNVLRSERVIVYSSGWPTPVPLQKYQSSDYASQFLFRPLIDIYFDNPIFGVIIKSKCDRDIETAVSRFLWKVTHSLWQSIGLFARVRLTH